MDLATRPLSIDVRTMVRQDLPDVLALEDSTFSADEAWPLSRFKKWLGSTASVIAVAEVQTRHYTNKPRWLAGYALVLRTADGQELVLERLTVAPELRRRGIGRKLLHGFLDLVRRGRYRRFTAEAPLSNLPACHFLRAAGCASQLLVPAGHQRGHAYEDSIRFSFTRAGGRLGRYF